MASHCDLEVYVASHALAVAVHRFTLCLAQFELYETGSQARRLSKSVSATIVEGFGRRRYKAEFVKYLTYAHASCDETYEWLKYIRDCHANVAAEAKSLMREYATLSKRIHHLIEAIENGHLTDADAAILYPAS